MAEEPKPGSRKPAVLALEIKDVEHQAVLRLQQEEIIQELRALVTAYEQLVVAVEMNGKIIESQAKITEMGLRLIWLIPVTLCFLFVGSYFFYEGKIGETFFGGLLFILSLPFLGPWIEKAITLIPIIGEFVRKQDPPGPVK